MANLTERKAVADSKKQSNDKIECPDLTPELGSKNHLLNFKQLYSSQDFGLIWQVLFKFDYLFCQKR